MAIACDRIGDNRVLSIMATEHEYQRELRARIRPLITGVGPIEAALATGMALAELRVSNALPDYVLCLGSAGSRRCTLGQVYQVSAVSWRDMDASRLGFAKGVTPFLDHPPVMPLHAPLPIASATLSTGANIVGGDDYDAIAADMVDMETFAVLRACQRFGIPLIGLRGISDGPEDVQGLLDWTALLDVLDARLAEAVDMLADALVPAAPDRA